MAAICFMLDLLIFASLFAQNVHIRQSLTSKDVLRQKSELLRVGVHNSSGNKLLVFTLE